MALYAELARILADRQKQILAVWVARTLHSYNSSDFFINSQDRFANPVGMLIRDGLTKVFELLRTEAEAEAFVQPLDQVIRIRAVQEFAASQAVVPFLELKWVVREVLNEEPAANPPTGELHHFDCAVDRVALTAFDLYCQCREQLYRTRIREVKSGRSRFTDSGCPSRLADAGTGGGASEKS